MSLHVAGSARALESLRWTSQTPPLRALDFEFAVRTTDPALGRYLQRTFRPFVSAGAPARRYSVVVRPAPDRSEVWFDEALIFDTTQPSALLSYLLWHVNAQVIEASSAGNLLVHASAAEHEGVGLVFPAPAECGKTTLVAGLVRAGLRYLTDEAAAIELGSGTLRPFPKALSIDSGSWPVLPALRPEIEPDAARFVDTQWHVDPSAIRRGAIGPRCAPGFVIAIEYQEGAATVLTPLRRSDAVLVLIRNSFNFRRHGAAGLAVLASVVSRSACYHLRIGDLDHACRLVLGLLEQSSGRRTYAIPHLT